MNRYESVFYSLGSGIAYAYRAEPVGLWTCDVYGADGQLARHMAGIVSPDAAKKWAECVVAELPTQQQAGRVTL